jgi:NADPH:quinone reductase-like Zn-dependent oxidoreductase
VSSAGAYGAFQGPARYPAAFGFSFSNGARLREIGTLVDAGLVRVIIGKEFPLSEAKAAHDLGESGHASGKIILRVQ